MRYENSERVIEFKTLLDKTPTVFHHFKGKKYCILTIAKDSETGEDVVVYQKQYDDYGYYVRNAAMFFSLVDKLKYPDCIQKYRFEMEE